MKPPRSETGGPRRPLQRASCTIMMLAWMLSAGIAGDSDAQTISGAGTRDCRAFNVAVERESASAIDSYVSWAQGFISGVNAANNEGINVAIDHAGLFLWMARYCTTHRDAALYAALSELVGLRPR